MTWPEQSRRFCEAMRNAGNRCDLHAFVLPDYTAPEPIAVKATRDGDFPLLTAGVVTMSVALVALNRTVWRRLYRLAETRFALNR